MTRQSNSGSQKMKGTIIDLQKLDSLKLGATAILQQNWGEIGKIRETFYCAVLLLL